MSVSEVRMGRGDDNRVYVQGPAKTFGLPYKAARMMARELLRLADECEEHELAERIIQDGAILDAANSPVGLTRDPRLKEEIRKEAQWGVGRKVPKINGVPTGEVVGTPGFFATPPDKERN